jgi:hypothetical protein
MSGWINTVDNLTNEGYPMKGHLTMSQKERKDLSWIQQVEQDQITIQTAAERCQVTERHHVSIIEALPCR